MAGKRRDKRNRVLRTGEFQRSDGRYEYKYTDNNGKRHSVYSWRLVDTDKPPAGKEAGKPLRDMEKEVQKTLEISGVVPCATTLNCYFEHFIETRKDLKPSTRTQYISTYRNNFKASLGDLKLSEITRKDVMAVFMPRIEEGIKKRTINFWANILQQVFNMAVHEGLLEKSPLDGLSYDIRMANPQESEKKRALTVKEQEEFVAFIKSCPMFSFFEPLFIFLLYTGCRIGEALAMTWDDIDFDRKTISINKATYRFSESMDIEEPSKRYVAIGLPKSKAGIRTIPMLPEAEDALKRQKMTLHFLTVQGIPIDGKIGDVGNFVFVGKHGKPFPLYDVEQTMHDAVETCNKAGGNLPAVTPHILRHTFCSRLCENGVNLKTIQTSMGHASYQMTMNVYTDITLEKQMDDVAAKMAAVS